MAHTQTLNDFRRAARGLGIKESAALYPQHDWLIRAWLDGERERHESTDPVYDAARVSREYPLVAEHAAYVAGWESVDAVVVGG